MGGQVVCAEDQRHGRQRALGGEEVFDESLNGDGGGNGIVVGAAIVLAGGVVVRLAMAGVGSRRGWARGGGHCDSARMQRWMGQRLDGFADLKLSRSGGHILGGRASVWAARAGGGGGRWEGGEKGGEGVF